MRKTNAAVVPALTLSVVLVLAVLPAAAKGRPAPELVDVTMTLVGDEGLTTDCEDADGIAGSLPMKRDRTGLSDVEGVAPILGLYMAAVAWDRHYPSPPSAGTGLAECHGGTVDRSPGTWDGALWITIDRHGTVTDVLWHLDYYIDGYVDGKHYRETVREHFTLSGHDLSWDPATSTVSGNFGLMHFLNDQKTGEERHYVPFPGSPRELAFTLTVEPHG